MAGLPAVEFLIVDAIVARPSFVLFKSFPMKRRFRGNGIALPHRSCGTTLTPQRKLGPPLILTTFAGKLTYCNARSIQHHWHSICFHEIRQWLNWNFILAPRC